MAVKPIPDGYHSVTPYLIVRNGVAALDFYKRAFGAVELLCMPGPNGTIAHAEIKIGNSPVMMGEEMPAMGFSSPQTLGGTPVGLMIYVENVDEAYARAIEAGGVEVRPLTNQFYGDRSGTLNDPFGHQWTLATHVEDVPEEELMIRMQKMMESGQCG